MSQQTAKNKMKLGRARKVLWQYRNEDIEEFEFIDAIHQLEDAKLKIIKGHITGMIDGMETNYDKDNQYKRGYIKGLSELHVLVNQELNNR